MDMSPFQTVKETPALPAELSLMEVHQQAYRSKSKDFGAERRSRKPTKNSDIFPFWIKEQRSLSQRIVKLTQRRQLDAAFEILEDAIKKNIKPNREVMNSAMAACVHCGDISQVYAVYESMLQPGNCGVDSITYNILLKGLSENRMFDKAFELVESLESGTAPGGSLLAEVHLRTLLNGFAEAGEMMRARGLLTRYRVLLNQKGPSIFTYNILIKGFSRSATPLEAMKLREDLVRYGLQPQRVTFNSLIHACVRGGDLGMALQLLREMKEAAQRLPSLDLHPDIVTYTTLIQGFGQQGLFDGMVSLVKELKASEAVVLDRVAYGVIIDSYFAIDSSSGFSEALSLLEEMIELSKEDSRLRPKPHLFLSVMRAFAAKGNISVVGHYRACMVPIAAGPVSPQNRVEADELLVEAAVNAGQFPLAKKILKDMKALKKGLPLSNRAYLAVIKLEFLSNLDNHLFRPSVLREGISLVDQVEGWMSMVKDTKPLDPGVHLSEVAMRFFYDAVIPIVNNGACIGVVHREDCYELSATLGSMMRGPPPSVSTITSVGKAIDLLLETKAKVLAVYEPKRNELAGFLMLESVLSLMFDSPLLPRNRMEQVLNQDNVT